MTQKNLLNETLGKYIRLRRITKRMTQAQLALKANIHKNYLGEVESGSKSISYYLLFCIARALETVPCQISKEVEQEILRVQETQSNSND